MSLVAATVECRGEQVAEELLGTLFGSTKVLRAESFLDRDEEDELATYLDLVLDDPKDETWPLEDVLKLRRAVIDIARRIDLETPIYVRLSPETNAPQEDDEPSLFSA